MTPDAERVVMSLEADHRLTAADLAAVRALVADRDGWRRQAERLERLIAEALRGGGVAGRKMKGSGV